MPFPKPEAVQQIPERETTRVRFDDGTVGEYYLRGGIAWPSIFVTGTRSEVKGYAILCGVNVKTDRCCVFESGPFNAVSPEVRELPTSAKVEPLGPLLNRWWGRWYASTFYWNDRGETQRQYRLQIVRDESIQPKPRLVLIEWDDDAAAEQVFWNANVGGRLAMEMETAKDVAERPVGEACPARHALVCALVGMQRRPWRMPEDRRAWENEDHLGVNTWRPVQ